MCYLVLLLNLISETKKKEQQMEYVTINESELISVLTILLFLAFILFWINISY